MNKVLFIFLSVILILCVFVGCSLSLNYKKTIELTLCKIPLKSEPTVYETIKVDVTGKSTYEELTLKIKSSEVYGDDNTHELTYDETLTGGDQWAVCYSDESGNCHCSLYKTTDVTKSESYVLATDKIVAGTTLYCHLFVPVKGK